MVVAIDIGNSYTHFGFYRGKRLISVINRRTATRADTAVLDGVFAGRDLEGVAIASVVPARSRQFKSYLRKRFRLAPLFISARLKLPLRIRYHRPANLGADRIAAAAGAFIRYQTDVLVLDFGTATTIDVVLRNGDHAGGVIAPGIGTSAWALAKRTALLRIEQLQKRSAVIGTDTGACIRSGVLNGTSYMVQGFIRNIRKKFHRKFLCVATGGWGKLVKNMVPEIERCDPDLCLFGIINLYHANI